MKIRIIYKEGRYYVQKLVWTNDTDTTSIEDANYIFLCLKKRLKNVRDIEKQSKVKLICEEVIDV